VVNLTPASQAGCRPPGAGPVDLAAAVGAHAVDLEVLDTDAVWVKSGARLWRLDPATNTMTQRTGDWEVGSGELAVVDGHLWLSGTTRTGARQIVRVDPSTSRVVDRFPTGGDGTLAVGGGSVWQAGITTQTIYRYAPTSRRLLAQIPIGGWSPSTLPPTPPRCG
jgi:hypothetical protein